MFLFQILSVLYKLYCSDNILLAVLWPSPTHFRLSSSMRIRRRRHARRAVRRRCVAGTYVCMVQSTEVSSEQRCLQRKADLAEKRERLRPWWTRVRVLPRHRGKGRDTYRGFQTRGSATPAHCLPHLNLLNLNSCWQQNLPRATNVERYEKIVLRSQILAQESLTAQD